MYELRFDQWSPSGEHLATLTADPWWFPRYDNSHGGSLDEPPSPTIESIWIEPSGRRLWVLGVIPDENWREGIAGNRRNEGGEPYFELSDMRKYFDGLVEVYDVQAGRLLASQRFDQAFSYFIDRGLVASGQYDSNGRPVIEVFQLSVR